jgi:para-aminobenzoate synthetase component 1
MLYWANRYNIFCFLDNQQYAVRPHRFELLLAVGTCNSFVSQSLEGLDSYLASYPGWKFGHLGYGLRNSIHHQKGDKESKIQFPNLYFFTPSVLLQVKGSEMEIEADDPGAIWQAVQAEATEVAGISFPLDIHQRLSREAYLETIRHLQHHIVRGDCYEINFCQEFFAEDAIIDPVDIFFRLCELSPNPFTAFYRYESQYLLCASPERYLSKRGKQILSQPMKGTIRRDLENPEADRQLKEQLIDSAKDRAENVMVVDLVRNDLSMVCSPSSVRVEELFGVYTYPQVHQMISTVRGDLLEGKSFSDIIKATFPMGSMTGAPKLRVMELIDQYEVSDRGIFSGSVGYIDPGGDFDFNVVIRSIMYNEASRYLSYQVGSGITFYSKPEEEWAECLLKGEAIKKVLTGEVSTIKK